MTGERTVLLTGASGRIGQCLLGGLLEDGWRVLAQVFRPQSADKIKALYPREVSEAKLVIWRGDLSQAAAEEELADWARVVGPPQALVYGARRVDILRAEDHYVRKEDFQQEWHLQVWVPYALSYALREELRRIVFLSSFLGERAPFLPMYENPSQTSLHYGVAKAALNQLVRELAVRFGSRTTVNAIAYGGVAGNASGDFLARYVERTPLGRMLAATKEDLYPPLRFLLDADNNATTGEIVHTDGGLLAW